MEGVSTPISTQRKTRCCLVWPIQSYKVLVVLNEGENVKLDIPAALDGLCIFNRDSIRSYIHRVGQLVSKFPVPPLKTGTSPRVIKILAGKAPHIPVLL